VQVETTAISGVLIVTPRRFSDDRGFFAETWNRRAFVDRGIADDWVQDNHSLSLLPGTLRGLHYQRPPRAQAKLVRCGRGRLFDVAVDFRRGSPTFGKWVGVELSADNGRQLMIPAGCLHGFVTREPDTEAVYKCSDFYAPDCDGAIRWDSAGVDWGLDGPPLLSPKDAAAPALAEVESPFTWGAP